MITENQSKAMKSQSQPNFSRTTAGILLQNDYDGDVTVMQLSIFAMTIPPRTPGNLHRKSAPTMGFLHLKFFPELGIYWGRSRGAGICLKTILAIFGIFIIIVKIGDWQHFGIHFFLL